MRSEDLRPWTAAPWRPITTAFSQRWRITAPRSPQLFTSGGMPRRHAPANTTRVTKRGTRGMCIRSRRAPRERRTGHGHGTMARCSPPSRGSEEGVGHCARPSFEATTEQHSGFVSKEDLCSGCLGGGPASRRPDMGTQSLSGEFLSHYRGRKPPDLAIFVRNRPNVAQNWPH